MMNLAFGPEFANGILVYGSGPDEYGSNETVVIY